MSFYTFWVPLANGSAAEAALNRTLTTRRVIRVEKHFCSEPNELGWAFCVECVDEATPTHVRKESVDYREVLDPETFGLFASLRTRRKEIAAKDGVLLFTVMSNENLAEIARRRCQTVDELATIQGIGKVRAEKYGVRLLSALSPEYVGDSGRGSGEELE